MCTVLWCIKTIGVWELRCCRLGGYGDLQGVLVFLTEAVGVHCPHGSELPGDDPMLCCWYVFWASAVCCELAGVTGLNVDIGLGMNPEVDGIGVLGKGYIPSHCNCLLMRSASLVTLSMMVIVLYSSGKSFMSSYVLRLLMVGSSSKVL